ncbi:hypothetical protein ANANG_G00041170 [Anguilla anguilla]|uniref:Uncharacterized protein n=1 Tax=Anguilla anguilla TaxID=7936 RepID=A0A9D3S426_ANGAN|nr:hypothetical protein ANANG_G00041170 [Anguilla anguilla]
MPKILATMLGHVVLQTLLVLWLAQNTLQGGTIHQGGGGVGKMLMPSRGAGVPLGMQGGHGHGAKPSKTGGGYGGAGGKHMKQGYISWPVYGAALGMGIGRGLGPQATKPRGGYGGNGFGYGGQAFGGYRPGASTYLRPGFGFGAGAGTGYPNVGGDMVLELGLDTLMVEGLKQQNQVMVLELVCSLDRGLNPMVMVQELVCPMDRELNPMDIMLELDIPMEEGLKQPNQVMVLEVVCPMDRVPSQMDMVLDTPTGEELKHPNQVMELESRMARGQQGLEKVFPMVEELNLYLQVMVYPTDIWLK